MSPRISSRDDLFLSALDLYTLLSLAFIGFAFFVGPTRDSEVVDLPLATGGNPDKGPGRRTVQWVRGAAPSNKRDPSKALCKLQLTEPGEGKGRVATYTSPCVPKAFGKQRLPDGDERQLRAGEGTVSPEVLILCRKSDGLAACASLQWLMHEAGFRTLAGVASEP